MRVTVETVINGDVDVDSTWWADGSLTLNLKAEQLEAKLNLLDAKSAERFGRVLAFALCKDQKVARAFVHGFIEETGSWGDFDPERSTFKV